jgi:hypothetical protein
VILTMSADDGMIKVSADRHVPGDSKTTDDGGNGPGNPNPLVPKGPRDLFRSRRIGLSRTVCTVCGATRDQGLTVHRSGCDVDQKVVYFGTPKWRYETTGPMTTRETSRDTGWR